MTTARHDRVREDYASVYRRSQQNPEEFWLTAAKDVHWISKPRVALDDTAAPSYRWFPDGVLNLCFNALDRHVALGRADQTALIYDSPVAGGTRRFSYADLTEQTAKFAGVLRALGVAKGDRVLIHLPVVPEAVVSMLACARIGAVYAVVSGGCTAHELADQITDARPKVIVSASCGIEPTGVIDYKTLLDKAIELSDHTPDRCVILQRPQALSAMTDRDVDYSEVMRSSAIQPTECVEVAATDPLYIRYASTTSDEPTGVVGDNGGHAVALCWSMTNIYDVGPGEVMLTAGDVGRAAGHSYLVYAPLLVGATTVLYEGEPVGTPDAGAFWRLVEDHQVRALITAPAAIRALREADPDGAFVRRYDLSSLSTLFLAGERLDRDTSVWASTQLGVPVVDLWCQIETGWPMAANLRGLAPMPIEAGSPTVAVPGFDIRVLDESGREVAPDVEGALCIRLPLPPGMLSTIWGDDQRFIDSYLSTHEGYYLSGDSGYLDADGSLFVLGRTERRGYRRVSRAVPPAR